MCHKQKIPLQFLSQGYTVTVSRRSTKRRNAVGHGFAFWLVKTKELADLILGS